MILLTDTDRAAVRLQLEVDEGRRLKPYRDTVGKLTIGIGRNLDDVGISDAEAEILLTNDIARAEFGLLGELPWVAGLGGVRKQVLVNMALNMGMATLLTFGATLAAIQAGDYGRAADQMEKSKWYGQVGDRARRLVRMMRTGQPLPPATARTVAALQRALNRLGADPKLSVDGSAGPYTIEAVRRFQAAHGLVTDGQAGPKTWAAIDDALAELDA